jgi:hypothetical protein
MSLMQIYISLLSRSGEISGDRLGLGCRVIEESDADGYLHAT